MKFKNENWKWFLSYMAPRISLLFILVFLLFWFFGG